MGQISLRRICWIKIKYKSFFSSAATGWSANKRLGIILHIDGLVALYRALRLEPLHNFYGQQGAMGLRKCATNCEGTRVKVLARWGLAGSAIENKEREEPWRLRERCCFAKLIKVVNVLKIIKIIKIYNFEWIKIKVVVVSNPPIIFLSGNCVKTIKNIYFSWPVTRQKCAKNHKKHHFLAKKCLFLIFSANRFWRKMYNFEP